MKVKDVIEKIDNIDKLIDKLEHSGLDYAPEVIWILVCYQNILKDSNVIVMGDCCYELPSD